MLGTCGSSTSRRRRFACMREAGLVAAEILDEICAGGEAGRLDLGPRPDRAPRASTSTRSRARSSATHRLPGGALHLDQRGHRPRHPAQERGPQGRRHHRDRLRHLQARLLRRHGPDGHGRQRVSPRSGKLVETAREALERGIDLCRAGQPARRHRPRDPELRGITRLFGRPPVRRSRHRPADARGPAGPELRRARRRANA